mgnify:CR=1 FL=1
MYCGVWHQFLAEVEHNVELCSLQFNMATVAEIYFPQGELEKTFINCIWRSSESDVQQRKEIILPKGTVEIIFNLSDVINYNHPSLKFLATAPTVFINGINFKPLELLKTGRHEFLGIQLNAIGLRLLFNFLPREFNDQVFEGKMICPELDLLAEELFCLMEFQQQVNLIFKWIYHKLKTINDPYLLCRAAKLMSLKHQNDLSVKKLSHEFCLSDRQLRRFSLEWLGMSTEEFILYNKYLHSLHLLHFEDQSLTDTGLQAGYYDQSHFIREFKSYTGLTPKQYKVAHGDVPGHIFE